MMDDVALNMEFRDGRQTWLSGLKKQQWILMQRDAEGIECVMATCNMGMTVLMEFCYINKAGG
jgi:uncharacterized membrane protein